MLKRFVLRPGLRVADPPGPPPSGSLDTRTPACTLRPAHRYTNKRKKQMKREGLDRTMVSDKQRRTYDDAPADIGSLKFDRRRKRMTVG